jgi:alpha-tubulin suppressor-like RCC1 family protein
VTAVACGSAHTVVVVEPATIYAFGWNEYGQVGIVIGRGGTTAVVCSTKSTTQH